MNFDDRTMKERIDDFFKSREKVIRVAVEIIIIWIALYFFHSTDAINSGGYQLAINGIVVARILCLLFALSRIPKLFDILFQK